MSISLTSLANKAAQDIGVLDSGESISAQQLTDALDLANAILDNWSSEQIQAPVAMTGVGALLPNTPSYSVGSALDWSVNPAPVRIVSAELQMSNAVTTPMKVVSAAEWDQIPDRTAVSDFVRVLFYTPLAISGRGLAKVSPVPRSGAASVLFQYWSPFLQFADVTTPIVIPAGYLWAMELALAKGMAPQFDVPFSAENQGNYQEAMNRVRALNAQLWGLPGGAPPA